MTKRKLSKTEIHEKEHFNKYADLYDKNYKYNEPFTKYKINKKANDFSNLVKKNFGKKKIKILEIGCGTGEYTKIIAKNLPQSKITGLDISPAMIKVAKEKCKRFSNIRFITKSAYETRLSDESFDVIYGFYVLHHLTPKKLSKEISRLLKKNGLIFFCEPNILNPAVYLIKSNSYLKQKVGDSPDEWGINPITIGSEFSSLKKDMVITGEFMWPFNIFSLKTLKKIDNMLSKMKYIPFLKYFGGSVYLIFSKS